MRCKIAAVQFDDRGGRLQFTEQSVIQVVERIVPVWPFVAGSSSRASAMRSNTPVPISLRGNCTLGLAVHWRLRKAPCDTDLAIPAALEWEGRSSRNFTAAPDAAGTGWNGGAGPRPA